MVFFHARFNEVADRQFLHDNTVRWARHDSLATYFREKADPEKNQTWKGDNPRPFLELPFHLARANADELAKILLDFNWLQAKTEKGLVHELIHDYDEALQSVPERLLSRVEALLLIQGTLRLSLHVVVQDPWQFAGQMVGRLLAHQAEPEIAAFLKNLDACAPRPRLRPLWPTLEAANGPVRRVLEVHSESVYAVALSADGKRAVFSSGWKFGLDRLPATFG